MARGGGDGVVGDLGDSRLQSYFLEHTFLWLAGRADHREFWNLPIFYPRENITAYSDTLLGAAPFYWLWRALSIPVDTAYQLWMLTVAALDFLAALLLLRRGLGFGTLAASTGAFLFAFGGARAIHLTHTQLLPQLYSIVAIYALLEVFRSANSKPRPGLLLVAGLSAVTQLYAGFYLGWFLLFGLAALAAAALLFAASRRDILTVIRRNGAGILFSAAVSLLVLLPLLVHSRRAAAELPVRRWEHTLPMVPTVESWLTLGKRSWLYGWLERPEVMKLFRRQHPDVPIGLGYVTLGCVAVGLWQARDRKWMSAVLVATAALILVTLRLPGDLTAWRVVWLSLPSASAVRAVFRIGVFLLLPAALGLACFLEGVRRRWVAALLAVACIAEQGTTMTTYSKVTARQRADWIAQRVGPGCRAFFFLANREGAAALPPIYYHVDAMMAQAQRGVPTVNGYSGQFPPGYGLYEIVVRAPEHWQIVHASLRDWMVHERLDPAAVCVVEEPYPFE